VKTKKKKKGIKNREYTKKKIYGSVASLRPKFNRTRGGATRNRKMEADYLKTGKRSNEQGAGTPSACQPHVDGLASGAKEKEKCPTGLRRRVLSRPIANWKIGK